ncbi:hypothetical protein cypCar_00034266 [Cyprinus carpio]|nr:hypothetical protein cypCar_00034266 [Cyprinus carpio]
MRKLERAGIKVLPASVRYNSPIVNPVEASKPKPPSPDIILRRDNGFMRATAPHQWDSNEEDDDEEAERKVPDVQKDDLASRRARMNQFKPSVAHHFLPGSCGWKDREKWEGIRLASQHAVLERMEKMAQEKRSQADSASPEVPIITRKDNPFLNPEKDRGKERDEEDEKEVEGKIVVPNPHKDDLARRRTGGGPRPPKDAHQSLVQTSITQSDLETWQRLKINTDSSESDSTDAEVSIITRKDNPFLTSEKDSECKQENEEGTDREKGARVVMPDVKTDDLARRRGQNGPVPQRDPRQSLAQTTITQSDLEKWQRLKMNTESSDDPIVPLCQTCLEKGCHSVASKTKVAKNDLASCRERSSGERRRFVTFGGVTEMKSTSWKEEVEDKEGGEGQGDEAEKLRYLLSMAHVAVPTIGLGSILTKKAVGSGDAIPEPAPIMPPEPPNPFMFDLKRPLTSTEHRLLEEELVEKVKDKREDDEEDEEEERQLDIQKDDMLARRTGAFQKPANGTSHNRFLPQPGSKRDGATVTSLAQKGSILMGTSGDRDLQYLERNIKTKRTKIGQRSVSLIDMRDEEDELAYHQPHSQSRHEHLHNQYNKLREEEDQWQDDLARWKNRRRSASQDLIKKEEERKMMEKLMSTDGGPGHRRKSIKTYKEIVEEKERREQELHEQYCKASTPEEKAAVLQRYALRFTISDAILEKLQLPKLPSAASPMHTPPLHQPEKKLTCTTLAEAEDVEPEQTVHVYQKTAQKQAPAQPETPEPSSDETIKAPKVLSVPTQVPPAPSKPVPMITPKPYSQPKFSQGLCKSIKARLSYP